MSACVSRDVSLTEASSFDIDFPDGMVAALQLATAPNVDGDTREYQRAPPLRLDNADSGVSGRYRFAWNSDALFVAADVDDPSLESLHDVRDAPLFEDDSLELMFDTAADGGTHLENDDYKFFVNLLNQQYDRRGSTTPLALWNAVWLSAVTVRGTLNEAGDEDIGYSIEMAIPWSAWGLVAPEPGAVWGANVVQNDVVQGERAPTPWQGSQSGETYFNIPDVWGRLEFWDEPRLYE
jgi:hypothetical protein